MAYFVSFTCMIRFIFFGLYVIKDSGEISLFIYCEFQRKVLKRQCQQ